MARAPLPLFNDEVEWIPLLVMAAILVAVVPVLAGSDRGRKATDLRLRRIERQLNLIMDHLDIREADSGAPPGVMEELAAGRKIQAIKLYRQATGVGLREAKDVVEALARHHLGA